jgi:hypothetical protein
MTRKNIPWPPEEDALLREVYPAGGWKAVHDRLPHRKQSAIHQRATRIGVASRRGPMAPTSGDPRLDPNHHLWARFCGVMA